MKKLLLIVLTFAMGIAASTAQILQTGAVDHKSAAAKPVMHPPLVAKQIKEAKTQIAPVSPFALNQELKVVSSISHGDKKIQLVQNTNGTFSKRVVSNNPVQKLNRKSTASATRSTADYTLFESFEDWDGSPNWTPKNWSRDNKSESVTWYITDESYFAYPTDGDYMAWIDWTFPFDDDFNLIALEDRNEAFISPAFIPVADDKLFFDVSYTAIFMFYDIFTDSFDFDNPIFNFQVLASTDNGTNWNILWDAARDEDYNEANIWDYTDNEWHSKMISLDAYTGRLIKIAFRYTDRDGGDDVGLDNIAVRQPNPTALYMRPQGYFKAGLTPDWGAYNLDLLFGHAYTQTIWRNLSTDTDAYHWVFENPDGSGTTVTRTEKNPNIPYPFDLYEVPILTATGGNSSSTYQWGNSDMKFLLAGGTPGMLFNDDIPGCGNYDLSYNFYTYTDGAGGYAFGTKVNNLIEGVANYFEKPVHKYILEGVWAALTRFSGFPANTEFTMVIHRVVDGYLDDEIATATCTPADVQKFGNTAFTMPFNTFISIDPDTGLEVENDYLEIEDAILIEIKGFNKIAKTEICFAAQEFDVDPVNENNAYIFLDDGRLVSYQGSTSLLFNLELTYSFLLANSHEFVVPNEGGSKTFDVISYFSPGGWWVEEDFPDWISDDIFFDSNTWEIQYTLIAEPLPANVEYRDASINIITHGADMFISVRQGKGAGILPMTKVADAKVVNKGEVFELTYAPSYSAVSVYTVAGQKIAGYALPITGTLNIPCENYSRGIYLFSFTGAQGVSTVKVIK